MKVSIRAVRDSDRTWIRALMIERWGGAPVVSRGVAHDPEILRGLVAENGEGRPVGLLTFEVRGAACEVVTLDAIVPRQGIGTMLLAAAAGEAARGGCTRLWLVTTNDNGPALAFYRNRGLRLVAVHEGAVARSRELKPSIPLVGMDGIPIRDEIELEMALTPEFRR